MAKETLETLEMVATKHGLTPVNMEAFESIYTPGQRYYIKAAKNVDGANQQMYGYFGFLCTWVTKNTLVFAGWRPTAVREFVKTKFAGEVHSIIMPDGTVMDYQQTPSAAALSKKEFSRMLDEWIAWMASELEITVPEANQAYAEHHHHSVGTGLDYLDNDYGNY